jgi:hypothetical protein
MLWKCGFGIAMGNASLKVNFLAGAMTHSTGEDGFADAVDQLILPRAPNGTGSV